MKTKLSVVLVAIAGQFIYSLPTKACTGITLKSKGETTIVARTIEWGGSNLNSQYVIVPRGHTEQSYTPDGMNGMTFTSRYGYVGFAVEQKDFVAEGLNEVGLSAGLFSQLWQISGLRFYRKREKHIRPATRFLDIGKMQDGG